MASLEILGGLPRRRGVQAFFREDRLMGSAWFPACTQREFGSVPLGLYALVEFSAFRPALLFGPYCWIVYAEGTQWSDLLPQTDTPMS